jgi:hypothetical protein
MGKDHRQRRDKRLLPAPYPPHPKIYGVQLHPEGREPFRGEVYVSIDNYNLEELYQPEIGDVRGSSSTRPLARPGST